MATAKTQITRHISFIHIAQDGAPGERGATGPYIPPPMLWKDYPSGYYFQTGSGTQTRLDIVVEEVNGVPMLYACHSSHTKKTVPPSQDPNCWHIFQNTFSSLATEVLLAQNAFINFLSGNSIRLFGGDNLLKGEFLGGNNILAWLGGTQANPMWSVDVTGKMSLGGLSGQRIEFDPTGKVMNIYNNTGSLIATHSGRNLTVAGAKPSNTNTTSGSKEVVIPTKEYAPKRSYETPHSDVYSICSGTASASGIMKITVPSFVYGVKTMGNPDANAKAALSVYLDIYIGNVLYSRRALGGIACTGYSADAKMFTSAEIVSSVSIPSGSTYRAEIVTQYYADNNSNLNGYMVGSSRIVSYEVAYKVYRCEYGANGWVISYDSNNYSYLIVEGGVLHFCIFSNGVEVIKC